MRYATADERATVIIECYADLLAIRAVPEYRFVDRETVQFDVAHLSALGIDDVSTSDLSGSALAPHLFDYQEWVTRLALERQRFAVFADTGLGKTAIQLEWARIVAESTGGRVLIVAPLNVCAQTIAESVHFYEHALPITDLTTGALPGWLESGAGLGITNYEKLDGCTDALPVAGLVLDESSILKQSMGKRRTAMIAAGRGLRYKLCCSATPAPNDRTEYAEHAYFLDVVRSPREFLAAFFVNRDGEWQLKRHGQTAFYRHLASWSVFMRDPKSYGFTDHLADMPPLDVQFPRIDLTPEQIAVSQDYQKGDQLSLLGAQAGGIVSRTKLMQIAHGFLLDAA